MPGSLRCTPANPKRHKNTAQEKTKRTKTITGQKQPKLSQDKKNSGSRTQVPSL